MSLEQLEQELSDLPIAQYVFFKTTDLEFSQRIRQVCIQECPRYGKTWACPPAVGTVEECKDRCLEFQDGIVFSTLTEVQDIANMEETLATRGNHEAVTHQVAEMFQNHGYHVMCLSTDSCAICDHCAYPDAPCRFPEKMYPCVESHGIVATALAEKHGIEYQYGNNVVTWFSIILFK